MFRFHPIIIVAAALTIPASALAHGSFAAGDPGDPKKQARVIEVRMHEGKGTMSYTPNRIEVIKGEQIRFVISNAGELDHEFMLDSVENNTKHKAAMAKNPEMEHDDPNGRRLEPQGTSEILWKFDKVGSFEFACLIPGHYEAGMHGVVVVKDER
ncbi:cupredoxin family protein [Hyphomicrobium sp.]|uniref:cupredoxin domain-containing protein n=1 Tax=Hyphomicrobium sp. TaxID=82 RepID=UPI002E2FB592|nr:cupredoxin family protein [Hyphomicrobium sp.]HEX2841014.1 cupredoxin family protein [Hyphomicrobium sp.]